MGSLPEVWQCDEDLLQVSLPGVLVRVLGDVQRSLGAGNRQYSTSLKACFPWERELLW